MIKKRDRAVFLGNRLKVSGMKYWKWVAFAELFKSVLFRSYECVNTRLLRGRKHAEETAGREEVGSRRKYDEYSSLWNVIY
jgi:hypothetical protein